MSTHETTRHCNGGSPTLALELVLARNDLTTFVQEKAQDSATRLGFSYEPCADAPSTYQQLRGAYVESQPDAPIQTRSDNLVTS